MRKATLEAQASCAAERQQSVIVAGLDLRRIAEVNAMLRRSALQTGVQLHLIFDAVAVSSVL